MPSDGSQASRVMLVCRRRSFGAGRLIGRRGRVVMLGGRAGVLVDLGLQDQRDGGEHLHGGHRHAGQQAGERRDEHDVAKQCHDGWSFGQWQGNAIEWR